MRLRHKCTYQQPGVYSSKAQFCNLFILTDTIFSPKPKNMNTNKFLVGGIIGGVVNFLLGWVVWGMLLMNFMKDHTSTDAQSIMRPEENMIWWSLIVANFALGFLFAYILSKAGTKSAGAGAGIGAVVGLLSSVAFNLFNYTFMNFLDMTGMLVDMLASMVVTAIVCAVIGWFYGRGAKAA